MKKAKSTFVVLASLAVAFITTPFASAGQAPGDGIVTTGRVALSKGTYKTFTLTSASGVSQTTTGTVSGTIAALSVTGNGLIASVSTTVTGTTALLDKKTIVKGKIGNKELLQLILNTTSASALKGQSLVWVSSRGGLLGQKPTELGGTFYVGAANLKAETPTVTLREIGPGKNLLGVEALPGSVDFLTSVVAGKKITNEVSAVGYGYAGVAVRASLATYSKSLIANTVNLDFNISTDGTYKETYIQNPTSGIITNSSKGTFGTKPDFGSTKKAPTSNN